MIIIQYMPRWLRSWLVRLHPGMPTAGQEDREVRPTLPKQKHAPIPLQDDNSPAGNRIRWHL